MMDSFSSWQFMMGTPRGVGRFLTPALAAILVVWLAAAPGALAGAVQEANAGRGGETLEVKSLAVSGKTTLIDFFSPYCPPCVRLAPLLEQLAQKRTDLAIVKVNINRPAVQGIDWGSPLAKQYNLKSVPHFMIFSPQGRITAEGRPAMDQVINWLKSAGLIN